MNKLITGLAVLLLSLNAFSRLYPEDERLRCVAVNGEPETFSLYNSGDGYQFDSKDRFRRVKIQKFDLFKGEISETKIDLAYNSFGSAKGSIVGEKNADEDTFKNVRFTLKYNPNFVEYYVPKLEGLEGEELECVLVNQKTSSNTLKIQFYLYPAPINIYVLDRDSS